MARRTQTYAIRLAVEGGGQVTAEIVTVGQSGKQSLKRVESAGDRASGGLKGLGRQTELLRAGIRTLGGALAGVATVGGLAANEVTTWYTYDGAKVVPPEAPALEEVRGLASERVEHGAEIELQAALGAKLPASPCSCSRRTPTS